MKRAKIGTFGMVPLALLREKTLTLAMLRSYTALASFQGSNEKCWPRIPQIAERAAVSEPTVKRAVGQLVTSGWLDRKRAGFGGGNTYTCLVDVDPFGSTGDPNDGHHSDHNVISHSDHNVISHSDQQVIPLGPGSIPVAAESYPSFSGAEKNILKEQEKRTIPTSDDVDDFDLRSDDEPELLSGNGNGSKKKKKGDPELQPLILYFAARHAEKPPRGRGFDPTIDWKRDMAIMKRLKQSYEAQAIREIIDAFFDWPGRIKTSLRDLYIKADMLYGIKLDQAQGRRR